MIFVRFPSPDFWERGQGRGLVLKLILPIINFHLLKFSDKIFKGDNNYE